MTRNNLQPPRAIGYALLVVVDLRLSEFALMRLAVQTTISKIFEGRRK